MILKDLVLEIASVSVRRPISLEKRPKMMKNNFCEIIPGRTQPLHIFNSYRRYRAGAHGQYYSPFAGNAYNLDEHFHESSGSLQHQHSRGIGDLRFKSRHVNVQTQRLALHFKRCA